MRRVALGLALVMISAVCAFTAHLSWRVDDISQGLHRAVAAQQDALLGFESARREDMAEVRGMVDYLGTDVDVCHKRAAITLWLVEQVAKTQRGRERIPALPEDWPERPEGGAK